MFCGNCGKEVKDEWKVCPYCNAMLRNKYVSRKTVKDQKYNLCTYKSKVRGAIGIAIVIIIIIAVTFGKDTAKKNEVNVSERGMNGNSDNSLQIDELPVYSMDYLSKYVDVNGIQIPKVSKKKEIQRALADDLEAVCLQKEGDKFIGTVEDTEWVYMGKMKDNKPDGIGKILKLISVNQYEEDGMMHLNIDPYQSYMSEEDIYFVLSYVGEFKDGYYSGYGWKFASPVLESDDPGYHIYVRNLGYDYVPVYSDLQQDILNSCNPIEYMGEFKKGERHGEGIEIEYSIREIPEYTDISAMAEKVGYQIDKELQITVGEFENDYINGEVKQYLAGSLLYSGYMKDGLYNGEGTLYYIRSEQIKYKGEWKDDKYHGQGILYNEDGTVGYDGKWDNGDYAS